ncbi:MAG: glycosyltransferase family 4 protein [Actinomycetota bacterium]|nr:glycosyltransferase family 4 protein [Actinomycetota bacterium]
MTSRSLTPRHADLAEASSSSDGIASDGIASDGIASDGLSTAGQSPIGHVVAVCATAGWLAAGAGDTRVLWDSRVLYQSLLRWGAGSVVPLARFARWQAPLVPAARLASHPPGSTSRWRSTTLARSIRDLAQVRHVVPPAGTEVLYGHIAFPACGGLPTIWSTQGVLDTYPGVWFPEQSARTHERFAQRAAVVQCWSELGRRGMLERCEHLEQSRVLVVPPLVYVDLDLADGTGQPSRNREPGDVKAIFVGAEGARKGLRELVSAVDRTGPGLRLEVVTADPRPEQLPSSVDWLGPLPRAEVLRRFTESDIHVLPSLTESFGGVCVEALAAGIPQVLAPGTVPAEIAGDSAILADPSDPAAIAGALARLAGDASLRARLGRLARQRFESFYCPEAVGPRMAELVEQACAS